MLQKLLPSLITGTLFLAVHAGRTIAADPAYRDRLEQMRTLLKRQMIEINDLGMIVDTATELLTIPPEAIQPAPELITRRIKGSYITGVAVIGKRVLVLIDLTKVLDPEDLANVAAS